MNKEEIIKLIRKELVKEKLIKGENNIGLVSAILHKYSYGFRLNEIFENQIEVTNVYDISITDDDKIRVSLEGYKGCSFDLSADGCFEFETIEEFEQFIKLNR